MYLSTIKQTKYPTISSFNIKQTKYPTISSFNFSQTKKYDSFWASHQYIYMLKTRILNGRSTSSL